MDNIPLSKNISPITVAVDVMYNSYMTSLQDINQSDICKL